jgi:SAM-dependent methyltransferase
MTKPDRGLHDLEEERAVPWGDPGMFAWHRARYDFASTFSSGVRVLDVGSGEGYGAAILRERAAEVVGIDYSPVAIEHARSTYGRPGLTFEVGYVEALSEAVGRFDLVTCFEVVEHLEDPRPLIAALASVTSDDGVCLVSTPNATVDRRFEAVAGRRLYEYHVGMLRLRDFRRLLQEQFASVEVLGQFEWRSARHMLLKRVDVFNIRHLVIRSAAFQDTIRDALGTAAATDDATAFRFSRALARQSPALLAVARRPRGVR